MNNLANIGGGNANGGGIPIDGFTTPPHPITMLGRKTLRTPVKDTTFANIPDTDFTTPTQKSSKEHYLMRTPSEEELLSAQKFVIPYKQEDDEDDEAEDNAVFPIKRNIESKSSSNDEKRHKIHFNNFK